MGAPSCDAGPFALPNASAIVCGAYRGNVMTKPLLLGLSGSLRAAATNRKLLREAARLFGDCTYVEADLRLPLYDGDAEDAEDADAPFCDA